VDAEIASGWAERNSGWAATDRLENFNVSIII
jgi:hypothetical protein